MTALSPLNHAQPSREVFCRYLCLLFRIQPNWESAYALSQAIKLAPTCRPDEVILVHLSGRGILSSVVCVRICQICLHAYSMHVGELDNIENVVCPHERFNDYHSSLFFSLTQLTQAILKRR